LLGVTADGVALVVQEVLQCRAGCGGPNLADRGNRVEYDVIVEEQTVLSATMPIALPAAHHTGSRETVWNC